MDPVSQNEGIESLCVGRDGYTVMIDGRRFEIIIVANEQDVLVFGPRVANRDES